MEMGIMLKKKLDNVVITERISDGLYSHKIVAGFDNREIEATTFKVDDHVKHYISIGDCDREMFESELDAMYIEFIDSDEPFYGRIYPSDEHGSIVFRIVQTDSEEYYFIVLCSDEEHENDKR